MTDTKKTIVCVSLDLEESIEFRGYKRPDKETLLRMKKVFEDWLWHEIEEHWGVIAERAGFDFEQDDEG